MCTDADGDEPLRFLHPHLVRLLVAQLRHVHRALLRDLASRPVPDEQRLVAPLHRHVLALGDVGEVHLDLGERQHVGRRAHRHHELRHHLLCDVRRRYAARCEVSECSDIVHRGFGQARSISITLFRKMTMPFRVDNLLSILLFQLDIW